jgi:membrane-associated HD superfamily phosphohydrolase
MDLLIMQFSPTSCHFIFLRSKYSPQHPVLKNPQSIFIVSLTRRVKPSQFTCSCADEVTFARYNPNVHVFPMFIILIAYRIVVGKFIGVLTACLHTIFPMCNCSAATIIAVKLRSKFQLCAITILYFLKKRKRRSRIAQSVKRRSPHIPP